MGATLSVLIYFSSGFILLPLFVQSERIIAFTSFMMAVPGGYFIAYLFCRVCWPVEMNEAQLAAIERMKRDGDLPDTF